MFASMFGTLVYSPNISLVVKSDSECSSGCEGWLGHYSPPWVAAARRESEWGSPGLLYGAVATKDHHCPVGAHLHQLNYVH